MTGPRPEPDVGASARLLRSRMEADPEAVVVLGSGLGAIAGHLERPVDVAFEELPGFPPAGVSGHAGHYVGGWLSGRSILVQAGRYHLYEGHPDGVVAAPVRVARALGARFLLLTNAAGGVDPGLEPGDVVLIDDHLDLTARHPLMGSVREAEARFPRMSAPYDATLQRLALEAATRLGITLRRGTYAGVHGPSYETAAEVRMLRRMGASVVGMSTVPEVIVARALGLRCLAVSVVANRAVGMASGPLSHTEVVEVVGRAGRHVERLLSAVLEALPQSDEAK